MGRLRMISGLALISVLPAFITCTPAPRRVGPQVERVTPPPNLQIELTNRLRLGWEAHYLQIYVDGWLLWEGVPEGRSGTLGTFALDQAGELEIYVRVLGTRRGMVGGALASEREMVRIGTGTERLRIELSDVLLQPRRIDVSIEEL